MRLSPRSKWQSGMLMLLCLVACTNEVPRSKEASSTASQSSTPAPVTTATPGTQENQTTQPDKKFTLAQLKLTNGDGLTIAEEKDIMADIDANPVKTQEEMYGRRNPFSTARRQKGTFNGTPFIVSIYVLPDSAQALDVQRHMQADFDSRKKTLPASAHKHLATFGNCVVSLIPKDNEAFVKTVLDKMAEKTR